MLSKAGLTNILAEAELIGDNVYNFYPRFKKYQDMFEVDGSTLPREEVVKKYKLKEDVIKAYDEIQFLKKNKDVVTLITSTMQMYDSSRYDFTNCEITDDYIKLVDRQSGDTHYVAHDQINLVIRYDKNATAAMIDPKTGERKENVKINIDKPREPLFYQT